MIVQVICGTVAVARERGGGWSLGSLCASDTQCYHWWVCVCVFSLGVHLETHSPCCALTYSRGDTTVSECVKVVSNKCIAITPRARAPHCVCIFARAISTCKISHSGHSTMRCRFFLMRAHATAASLRQATSPPRFRLWFAAQTDVFGGSLLGTSSSLLLWLGRELASCLACDT
jgi:hypothetical protein